MNWNAVIKSLQEEAKYIASRLDDHTLPAMHRDYRLLEVQKMEIFVILAKALAEGMKDVNPHQKF